MNRDVFGALADPKRREILHMIASRPLNVNAVAGQFEVSRTAIYKHVRVLKECGLLVIKKSGREHFYEVKLGKLSQVSDWVAQCEGFWNGRLETLEKYLKETQSKKKKHAIKRISR